MHHDLRDKCYSSTSYDLASLSGHRPTIFVPVLTLGTVGVLASGLHFTEVDNARVRQRIFPLHCFRDCKYTKRAVAHSGRFQRKVTNGQLATNKSPTTDR